MTIRNFNSIFSSQATAVASDLINEVTTSKWDNKFDGLTLFNSQVRVAKLLTVDGDSKVGGALAASGAVNFGSTLGVDSATTLNNTLYGAGAATFGNTLAASGAVTFGSTLYGAGAATFGSTLAASGAVDFGGTLNVASTGSFGALTVYGDTTLIGVLRGPQNFIIDPSQYDNETGTVTIRGNLVVNGLTTTINSETLDVKDLNLTLAKGSLTKNASNEAGLTIELGPTDGSAEFKYQSLDDNFRVNKLVRCASGPVHAQDLTNKAYVDGRIVAAGSQIAANTIGFNVINGFKFKVIQQQSDFNGNDICLTENNILYIWNNGTTFSINLPYQGVGWNNTAPLTNVENQVVTVYNGINMFAYRTSVAIVELVPEDHWTNSG